MEKKSTGDRNDYLTAIGVSQEDMIHVERLMQGTSRKDELPMPDELPCDSSTLEEPGSTRVENIQAKGWPLREGRVSGSTVSFIIQYLFKEDVDGRS